MTNAAMYDLLTKCVISLLALAGACTFIRWASSPLPKEKKPYNTWEAGRERFTL